jgi:HlyD family secretion protein
LKEKEMSNKIKAVFYDEDGKWKMKKSTTIIIGVVIGLVALFLIVPMIVKPKNGSGAFQTEALKRGELTAQVGATGTIHSDQTANLAWKSSGTIEKINTAIGQKVNKGDILAVLATTSMPQNVIQAKAQLITAERSLEDVKASNTAAAQAQLALVNAEDAVKTAKNRVLTFVTHRGSDDMIDTADSQLTIADGNLVNAETYFKMFDHLKKDDPNYVAALSRLTAARTAYDQAKTNFTYLTDKPSALEVQKNDAKLAIAVAQLADAQRAYDRVKDGPNADDIAAAQAQVDALQATIDTAYLMAPISGEVTDMNIKVGDQVSPGPTAIRVDDLGRMLVDVAVSEVDISRIKPGQDATITLDAVPGVTYPGKVTEVARVADVVQGVANFNVTVQLTQPDENVLPGMTAAVNIIVDKLENALLLPNRAVRLENGKRVVYVLRNGKPEKVGVTLGLSSDTYSEIIDSGLNLGDLIILNPPLTLTGFQGRPSGGGSPFGGGQ